MKKYFVIIAFLLQFLITQKVLAQIPLPNKLPQPSTSISQSPLLTNDKSISPTLPINKPPQQNISQTTASGTPPPLERLPSQSPTPQYTIIKDIPPGSTLSAIQNKPIPPAPLPTQQLKKCREVITSMQKKFQIALKQINTQSTQIDTIIRAGQTYYTTTLLPAKQPLRSYSQITQNITDEKKLVQNKIATIEKNINSLNCSSENPSAQVMEIQTNLKDTYSVIQGYKTYAKSFLENLKEISLEATSSAK